MLQNLLGKREKGFTIIEVMIVLAIAGLILVVVLIAIPQLQRNQRNQGRQNDASRVATAVSNWMANNSGNTFTAGASNANLVAVGQDLGQLSQYEIKDSTGVVTAASVTNIMSVATGSQSAITSLGTGGIRIVTGARCDSATPGATTTTGATTRQFVVQYATENSSTTGVGACLSV